MHKLGRKVDGLRKVRLGKDGKFLAIYKKWGVERILSKHETSVEAAQAVDRYQILKRGLLGAFPMLNYPELYRDQYQEALKKRQEQQERESNAEDQRLRKVIIPAERLGLHYAHYMNGKSIPEVAAEHGYHPEALREALAAYERSRLEGLGLNVSETTEGAVIEHARVAIDRGESIRSISSRLGFDRRWLSRHLGSK